MLVQRLLRRGAPRLLRRATRRSMQTMTRTMARTTSNNASKLAFAAAAAVAASGGVTLWAMMADAAEAKESKKKSKSKKSKKKSQVVPGAYVQGLPEYTYEEVAKHKGGREGVWVTFGDGVYDVTKFIEAHPGGPKILMAAGGALEPYWRLYASHKTDEVFAILEGLRVGNVSPQAKKEREREQQQRGDSDDPYANEPERHPALSVGTKTPFNAETPVEILADHFLTPNELWYVRNHLPVPQIKPEEYVLEVVVNNEQGQVQQTRRFTLRELKEKFEHHTVMSTIQCAGNRRREMADARPGIRGLKWQHGAISNAEWTGVRLGDVLRSMGVDEQTAASGVHSHIHFEGADVDPTRAAYGSSIPIEKALDQDVLLAFTMNGEELPPDHGFPVRAVVPGVVGARNVKWLTKVVAARDESESFWQRRDYKIFAPYTEKVDAAGWDSLPSLQDLPVISAITQPQRDAQVSCDDTITVKGYAYSGGGRGINRVDVSADGGKTFQAATFTHRPNQKRGRIYAWSLWEADVDVSDLGVTPGDKIELVVRAVDDQQNTQPHDFKTIWNIRGLCSNAWHRVPVNVTD
eukprot:TRINITY_DN67549_c13_g3_i1.p1 TRINITY_DN67549_c13_g3~~TRINITY_DN67549_c13_g3_i1.p1  ORF type:complete len:578 (-),score=327.18 TRINITY_DN67549_c13_g3_i1:39-1772(-)